MHESYQYSNSFVCLYNEIELVVVFLQLVDPPNQTKFHPEGLKFMVNYHAKMLT